jgi:flagellar hook-basal body complex protein FliE
MTVSALSPLADIPFLGSSLPSKAASAATPGAGATDFASVLSGMATQTATDVRTAETFAIKGLQGQAPVQDVAQSMMQAQTSLQTALAIRDKAVSAYQELTRMTI